LFLGYLASFWLEENDMQTNDPNILIMLFYLTGAILLLTVAIITYPTLRERARREKKIKKKDE
jgi:hypothetical protein